MAATSIDEIVDELDEIVGWARQQQSRVGYFAAMYRKVTLAVKSAIDAGEFEDPARMTRLDVIFALRYIGAFRAFVAGEASTHSWQAAFESASKWRPIIIQHLLVGMNAHINLDLGIAAAAVAPGAELAPLKRDFDTINVVLARMIDGFVDDVAEVSPWIWLLDRIGGRAQSAVIRFSIDTARDEAWRLATQLAPLAEADQLPFVNRRDTWTADFASVVLKPGWLLSNGLFLIRARESNNVGRVIDALSD